MRFLHTLFLTVVCAPFQLGDAFAAEPTEDNKIIKPLSRWSIAEMQPTQDGSYSIQITPPKAFKKTYDELNEGLKENLVRLFGQQNDPLLYRNDQILENLRKEGFDIILIDKVLQIKQEASNTKNGKKRRKHLKELKKAQSKNNTSEEYLIDIPALTKKIRDAELSGTLDNFTYVLKQVYALSFWMMTHSKSITIKNALFSQGVNVKDLESFASMLYSKAERYGKEICESPQIAQNTKSYEASKKYTIFFLLNSSLDMLVTASPHASPSYLKIYKKVAPAWVLNIRRHLVEYVSLTEAYIASSQQYASKLGGNDTFTPPLESYTPISLLIFQGHFMHPSHRWGFLNAYVLTAYPNPDFSRPLNELSQFEFSEKDAQFYPRGLSLKTYIVAGAK